MKPDFREEFQPEGGDPEGSPECQKDFQPEGGDPAGRRRLKPNALRDRGTLADKILFMYVPKRMYPNKYSGKSFVAMEVLALYLRPLQHRFLSIQAITQGLRFDQAVLTIGGSEAQGSLRHKKINKTKSVAGRGKRCVTY